MLALKRKHGEKLVIDGPCVITVIGGDTRLGVEAESHVRILRSELLEAGNDDPTDVIDPSEECDE